MFAVLGIILLVAGAIITFAVEREAEGVDLETLGWILMAGGALSLLVSLFVGATWWSTRNARVHTERVADPASGAYVEDTKVSGRP
jgi:Domain of unknown function (DUF6458)